MSTSSLRSVVNMTLAQSGIKNTICVLLASTLFFFQAAALSDVNVTVCSNVYWAPYQSHLDFAYRNFPDLKAEFWPNINVVGAPLAFTTPYVSPDDFQTTIGAVRSWIRGDGDALCDIFIGPSISDTAIAMSPLIEQPLWIDYGATSTQLTNKDTYPAFLRTIPSDEQGAMKVAELLNFFGWKNIFIIKADNSYATTWTAEISMSHALNGGNVVRTYNTLSSTVTEESLTQILFEILSARTSSRIIVAVGVDYALMNTIFLKHNLGKELIVIYSEEPCSNSQIDWNKVHGALCVTIGYNQQRYDQYMAAFAARSETDFNRSIVPLQSEELNYPYEYLVEVKDENDVYGSISVDSLWYGLTVLQKYLEAFGDITHNSVTLADFARSNNITFPHGLTGPVSVNSQGDRLNFIGALHNTAFDNSSASIGIVGTDGSVIFESPVYMLGQKYDFSGLTRSQILARVPTDRIYFVGGDSQTRPTFVWIIIGLIFLIFLCLGAAAAYIFILRYRRSQGVRYAPKSESEPVAIVFTDVQSSTAIWAECSQQMCAALDLHNALIRKCITEHRGYEVKTIGDSFMVAFCSGLDAVRFALAVQECLYDANWNSANIFQAFEGDQKQDEAGEHQTCDVQTAINNFYMCYHPHDDPNTKSIPSHSDVVQEANYPSGGSSRQQSTLAHNVENILFHSITELPSGSLYNGLRVRVGASFGFVSIRKTAREGATGFSGAFLAHHDCNFDYFGSTVNTAARIEAIGHGGQVLISNALWIAAENENEALRQSVTASDRLDSFSDIVKVNIGPIELRGLANPVEVNQISSSRFASRTFPPLRLDKASEPLDMEENVGGGTTGDNSQANTEIGHEMTTTHSVHNNNASSRGINEVLTEIANRKRIDESHFRMVYCVLEIQLSILSKSDATETINSFLKKWRIDYKKECEGFHPQLKTTQNIPKLALKIALLAARIAPAATLKFDKLHSPVLVKSGTSIIIHQPLPTESHQNIAMTLNNTPRGLSHTHIGDASAPTANHETHSNLCFNLSTGYGNSVSQTNV